MEIIAAIKFNIPLAINKIMPGIKKVLNGEYFK